MVPSTAVMPREGSFALAFFGRLRKVQASALSISAGRKSFALKRILEAVLVTGMTNGKEQIVGRSAGRRIVYHSVSVQKRKRRRLHTAAAAGPAGIGATAGVISALSVISLRRNGISTTSTIPTARLPAPSSVKSFAYPASVATAVVPVGSGIVPEKSPAKSERCEAGHKHPAGHHHALVLLRREFADHRVSDR